MPLSRGRKKPRKQQVQRQTRVPQEQRRKSLWERIRDHWLWWGISALAAVIAIGSFVNQVFFLEPEIDISESGATLPFDAPIRVTNQSSWFAMRDAYPACNNGKKTVWKYDNGPTFHFYGGTILRADQKRTIEPGKIANFQCRFGDSNLNELKKADWFISVKYKTLWITRESDLVEFVWFTAANPPRWVKGPVPYPNK